LRSEYPKFQELDCEIVDVGPDSAQKFRAYWAEHSMPFVGLADPDHVAAKRYQQAVKLLKLGRMPLQLIVDREGIVRQRHDSNSMSDIPSIETVLDALARLA
jgi:peroxiredoxin Q/BCP